MRARIRKRRRPARIDTQRVEAIRVAAAHLEDLRREHRAPPPDVKLPGRSAIRLVCPILEYSWCASPAQMCAELAE